MNEASSIFQQSQLEKYWKKFGEMFEKEITCFKTFVIEETFPFWLNKNPKLIEKFLKLGKFFSGCQTYL